MEKRARKWTLEKENSEMTHCSELWQDIQTRRELTDFWELNTEQRFRTSGM
jgi:hypothetical protein